MKVMRFLIVLALVAVALGFGAGSVRAQAFSYTTGFQVQNLENAEASVNIAYYNQDGTLNVEVDDTIAANDSNTYFPIAPAAGFNGSVVIASSTKVATVVNILGDNGAAAASYVGSSAAPPAFCSRCSCRITAASTPGSMFRTPAALRQL
jgi:hypothetical protein